jgi:large subunit ribosomal protein L23
MSLLNLFKNKKEEKKAPKKEVKKAIPKKPRAPKVEKVQKPVSTAKRVEKKELSDAWRVLNSAHVTEKASRLAEKNEYIFKVEKNAGKQEIKKAIQNLYGVAVERVNVIKIPGKLRRVGKNQGYKQGYKKAIVKLFPGEKIEILPR